MTAPAPVRSRPERRGARRHAMTPEHDELVLYMEWLRSGFPRRKLAHVGPAAWTVVDLR